MFVNEVNRLLRRKAPGGGADDCGLRFRHGVTYLTCSNTMVETWWNCATQ